MTHADNYRRGPADPYRPNDPFPTLLEHTSAGHPPLLAHGPFATGFLFALGVAAAAVLPFLALAVLAGAGLALGS